MPIESRIRVMVVENDPLMRIAVGLQLEKLSHVHVVASTTDGCDVLRLLDSLQPDLVVSQAHTGETPAFAPHLKGLCPNARLILLTDEPFNNEPSSLARVEGCVVKDRLCRELPAAIERMFGSREACESPSA